MRHIANRDEEQESAVKWVTQLLHSKTSVKCTTIFTDTHKNILQQSCNQDTFKDFVLKLIFQLQKTQKET